MKKINILAIDIGNTSAHLALYSNGRFGTEFRVPTAQLQQLAATQIRKRVSPKNLTAAVIASVVPEAGRRLKKIISDEFGFPVWLIGKDVPVPIVNRYKNPRQVGIDRLLNAYAAYRLYRRALVIIDFGTAITFDIVSKKGEYLGGIIAPGIEISLEALFQKTALLPKIRLRHPSSLIGRDTVESIRVGCSVGIGGLCDRVIERLRRTSLRNPLVIATGGYARFMRRYCKSIDKIDDQLVLKGIVWSLLRNKKF